MQNAILLVAETICDFHKRKIDFLVDLIAKAACRVFAFQFLWLLATGRVYKFEHKYSEACFVDSHD